MAPSWGGRHGGSWKAMLAVSGLASGNRTGVKRTDGTNSERKKSKYAEGDDDAGGAVDWCSAWVGLIDTRYKRPTTAGELGDGM